MTQAPFQAGGPLPANSPVYVPREADKKAAAHLRQMKYITLIAPPEQGKTSLINQLIGQFSPQGYTFAMRDLMAARATTPLADWYASLGKWVLRQLSFIPRDRWPKPPAESSSLEDFLADVAESAEAVGQNVVIVLDEIGAMPPDWATDLFSVIRSIYSSRQNFSFWRHLTFIFSGIFSPKELIQNSGISPFNVDQHIHLNDFSLSQVKRLAAHLGLPGDLNEAVAERVHYWTDGQPYLTQWLCCCLAEQKELITASTIDSFVDDAVERFFHKDLRHLARIKDLIIAKPDLLTYTRSITREPLSRFSAALNDKHFHLAYIVGVIKASPERRCQIRNRIYGQALAEIVEEHKEGGQDMTELPPEVKVQAISFLFDIGRWATSELKERWTLARQKKGAKQTTEVDLSKPKKEIEKQSETLLQDIAAERGAAEVERVLGLIEQKRDLILEWKESKVANEEEYSRQLISRAALQLRQRELEQRISQTLVEIEADLKELGVQINKEEADQPTE